MKKFLFKSIIFLAIIAIIDMASRPVFTYLKEHAKGGDTGRLYYISSQMDADVLIFGSSRAMHHYDPILIEDSLGMSCYNCGKDGNGIIFLFGQYQLITSHHQPKVIIYDICESFDLLKGSDNHKYLGWLRNYYDAEGVDSIFWKVDATERFKMLSSLYAHNSKFVQMISDNIHPLQQDMKGYKPVDKVMAYEPKEEAVVYNKNKYDDLKLYYLERLIQDCKARDIQLIFSLSPKYKPAYTEVFAPAISLAETYNIPFVNNYYCTGISDNKEYFYDSVHMNREGATKFTQLFIEKIKMYIGPTK